MLKPPLVYISFSPSTRFKDLLLNLFLMFRIDILLGITGKGNLEKIRAYFSSAVGGKPYLFNHARSGMYTFFKSLNPEEGDQILFQGFTCTAAINPARWAGFKVVYADVSDKTLSLTRESVERVISDKTRVIVYQYNFGIKNQIREVAQLCKERGIILMEDCAHLMPDRRFAVEGIVPGTLGDVAVFSFGRDKILTSVQGGAVVLNNAQLEENFDKEYETVSMPPIGWQLRELLFPLSWAVIKMFYRIPKLAKGVHWLFTKLGMRSHSTTDMEKRGQMPAWIVGRLPHSLARLAVAQLEDLDHILEHRIEISQLYEGSLRGISGVKQFPDLGSVPTLRYPILVQERDELLHYLESRNIIAGYWFSKPVEPIIGGLELFEYEEGSCPTAEKLCSMILNLPTNINTSVEDAKRVVAEIDKFYNNRSGNN